MVDSTVHIVDVVYYWARTKPLHPAVIESDGIITYASLAQAIESAAHHFASNIKDRSKPVAVSIATGSKLLVAILGLLRAGFNVVLAYKAVLEHVSTLGTHTLVCERDGTTSGLLTNIVFDNTWLRSGTIAPRQDGPVPQSKTTGGNILCFTSGTTGRPKIVVCPQSSWQKRMELPLNSAYSSYERMLIVPGLGNSWGFSRAYEVLRDGRTVCLSPTEQQTLWMLNTYGIDIMLASPQQALMLVELQEKVTRYQLQSLKSLHIGASVISRDGIQRIQKYLCRNVIVIYGSTEAGVVAVAPYDMIANIPSAVGFIVPGVDVEIVDAAGRALPVGSEGFVRVRSPVLMENLAAGGSAVSEPDATWFYPGDLGWLTDGGILCIAGRAGDVLNRGGVKLSVSDFEDFLRSCPGVRDAGVCTLMGASGFEEVWVGIVLEPSADIGALRQKIEGSTDFGTNIDKLFVVENIPRGALGKIQRDELKKSLEAIAEEADSAG